MTKSSLQLLLKEKERCCGQRKRQAMEVCLQQLTGSSNTVALRACQSSHDALGMEADQLTRNPWLFQKAPIGAQIVSISEGVPRAVYHDPEVSSESSACL